MKNPFKLFKAEDFTDCVPSCFAESINLQQLSDTANLILETRGEFTTGLYRENFEIGRYFETRVVIEEATHEALIVCPRPIKEKELT